MRSTQRRPAVNFVDNGRPHRLVFNGEVVCLGYKLGPDSGDTRWWYQGVCLSCRACRDITVYRDAVARLIRQCRAAGIRRVPRIAYLGYKRTRERQGARWVVTA